MFTFEEARKFSYNRITESLDNLDLKELSDAQCTKSDGRAFHDFTLRSADSNRNKLFSTARIESG